MNGRPDLIPERNKRLTHKEGLASCLVHPGDGARRDQSARVTSDDVNPDSRSPILISRNPCKLRPWACRVSVADAC